MVFSWHKNGALLAETDVNHTLSRAKLSDAGNYTCTVKNDYGSVQHRFNVEVYGNDDDTTYSCDVLLTLVVLSIQTDPTAVFLIHRDNNVILFTADKNKLPVLVESPQNLTLKPGDVAWFACKAYDPRHTKVDWYYLNNTDPSMLRPNDILFYKKIVNQNTVSFCFYISIARFVI